MRNSHTAKKYALLLFCFLLSQYLFAQPTISSFAPASGPVGTTVTITGTNFNTTASNNIVFFGAVRAAVTAASSTSLTVIVPTGATYQPLTVTVAGLTAWSQAPFSVTFPDGEPAFNANSFAPGVTAAAGTDAIDIAEGDLDGDGKADLVVTNRGSNTISVFRNTSIPSALSFATKQDLTTGTGPVAVAIGDVDGDGKPDIVVANSGSNNVSVLKNTSASGSISFTAKTDYPAGGGPSGVAIGDIDGDGKADIAVTNGTTSNLSILVNSGAAGAFDFTTKMDFVTSARPVHVAIGDLNNDNKPEVITVNLDAASISVFQNVSAGPLNLLPRNDYATGYGPQEVAIGDLDDDGKPELTVAGNQTITVFKNVSSGPGGLIQFNAGTNLFTTGDRGSISLTDMDGDGKTDMVCARSSSNRVSVIRNTAAPGSASFPGEFLYNPGFAPTATCTGDLDGDGKPDIATSNFGGSVSILRNRTNEPAVSALEQHNGCAVAGSTVIVRGTNFYGVSAVSFGGTPATSFNAVSPTEINAVVAAAITTNVKVTTQYGEVTWAIPPPTITSFTPVTGSTGSTITIKGTYFCAATAVSIGGVPSASFSVISDTVISAVIGATASGSVSVTTPYGTASLNGFYNGITITSFAPLNGKTGASVTIQGSGFSTTPSENIVFFGAVRATVTQADNATLTVTVPVGAKYSPITVTTNQFTAYSRLPFNPTFEGGITITPESFEPKKDVATGTSPGCTVAGDLDGDGKPDLAVVNFNSNTVSVFKNTGSEGIISLDTKTDYATGIYSTHAAIGDLDGDGKPDLAVISSFPGKVSVFKNTSVPGTISFAAKSDFITGSILNDIYIHDLDSDGKPDLALADDSSDIIILLRNISANGVLSFGDRTSLNISSTSNSVFATDLNDDGKPDLVASNVSTQTVSVFKNKSTPGMWSFETRVDYAVGVNPYEVVAGDLDADNKIDLAIANFISNTVSTLKNSSAGGIISFDPKVDFANGTQSYSVCLSDLDGNGKPDVATNSYNTAALGIFRNISAPGNILLAPGINFTTGLQPANVIAVDMDGDGKPDLVSANFQSNNISILRNKVGEPKVEPSGANPVTGTVINKVTVDATVQVYNGSPFVQRHYDIEPVTNPQTATATITLYFTQQEFDNFNAHPAHGLSLPTGPSDAVGKANLRVYQYHGFSTTSLPGSYTGISLEINPDDAKIVWNTTYNWWEVTFDVTGFSGFFVSSAGSSLPLKLLSFTGETKDSKTLLQWVTTDEKNTSHFDLLRSTDGRNFSPIATIPAAGNSPANKTYQYTDKPGAAPVFYYRLKMVDIDYNFTYSSIISVKSSTYNNAVTVYPNPAKGFVIIGHPVSDQYAQLRLIDVSGKLLKVIPVSRNTFQTRVELKGLATGVYKITWNDGITTFSQTLLIE